jgi:hypothetical protein
MMIKRAAIEAAKRGVLVWIVAGIVVLIGLVVFNKDPHLSEWAWRVAVTRELGR